MEVSDQRRFQAWAEFGRAGYVGRREEMTFISVGKMGMLSYNSNGQV